MDRGRDAAEAWRAVGVSSALLSGVSFSELCVIITGADGVRGSLPSLLHAALEFESMPKDDVGLRLGPEASEYKRCLLLVFIEIWPSSTEGHTAGLESSLPMTGAPLPRHNIKK